MKAFQSVSSYRNLSLYVVIVDQIDFSAFGALITTKPVLQHKPSRDATLSTLFSSGKERAYPFSFDVDLSAPNDIRRRGRQSVYSKAADYCDIIIWQ